MKNYLVFAILIAVCLACKFGSIESTKTTEPTPKSNITGSSPANKPEKATTKQDSKSENHQIVTFLPL